MMICLALSCGKEPGIVPEFPGEEETDISDKPVMLWVDASANFSRFVEKSEVDRYLNLAREAGFTDIILDVRPTSGEVMYKGSSYADEIVTWKGVTRDDSWDYLEYFIGQTHKLGMRIYAAMNTFTAGQNILKRGMAYNNPEIAELVSVLYTQYGKITGFEDTRGAIFINPALEASQTYILNIVKEIVSKYDIDGLMLDRCRYDNETADFSDESGELFAAYVKENYGREGISFPDDVMTYDNQGKPVWGIYEKIWYEWRASVIHDFFFKCRGTVKSIKPDVKFATYTGAWYSSYYNEGSNWASSKYDPSAEFSWANSRYKNTGFAEALDYHLAGVYYRQLSGDGWWTIAGGIKNSQRVNCGACPVIASLAPEKFPAETDRPDFQKTVSYVMKNAGGMMVFDLYHVDQYDYWDIIKAGIEDATKQ